MKAFILDLDGTLENARQSIGAVAAAPIKSAGGKKLVSKGHVITEDDLPSLLGIPGARIPLLMPESGDLHEDEAALRLGFAVAGEGVEVRQSAEGRVRLLARHKGLLRVDVATLQAMNSLECVSIYTLFDRQPVHAGEEIGEAKITPLLAPGSQVERAASYAATMPVTVLPFKPLRAAALIIQRVSPDQARRVAAGLSNKLGWFGSSLQDVRYISPGSSSDTIAHGMREDLARGLDVLFVAGGSAANPLDPLLGALEQVPARMERLGIPAHPGSMLWLARAGDVPIIGVPSCGMFSQTTTLDLVLPELHTARGLTAATFAALGHGGLLRGGDPRFPDYARNES